MIRRIVIIIAILLAGWVGGTAVSIYTYAQQTETRKADAAIVLGAAVFGEQLSPVLRERINHAIGLYEQGYVSVIIFTGGLGAGNAAEGDVAAQYAIAQGIPAEAILVENESADTIENLTNAQTLANEYGLQTFLIVSTPFHMKRAMSIAADLEMTAYTSPTRTIQWISWYTKSRAFVQEVGSYIVYLFS
jgi:uncharacterized SAM-binding protein YcdF (DUF218 family)